MYLLAAFMCDDLLCQNMYLISKPYFISDHIMVGTLYSTALHHIKVGDNRECALFSSE